MCWFGEPSFLSLSSPLQEELFTLYPTIQGTAQTDRMCIPDQYRGPWKGGSLNLKNEKHYYSLQLLKAQKGTIFSSKLSGFHCTYYSQTCSKPDAIWDLWNLFLSQARSWINRLLLLLKWESWRFSSIFLPDGMPYCLHFCPCCASSPTWSPQRWRGKIHICLFVS